MYRINLFRNKKFLVITAVVLLFIVTLIYFCKHRHCWHVMYEDSTTITYVCCKCNKELYKQIN